MHRPKVLEILPICVCVCLLVLSLLLLLLFNVIINGSIHLRFQSCPPPPCFFSPQHFMDISRWLFDEFTYRQLENPFISSYDFVYAMCLCVFPLFSSAPRRLSRFIRAKMWLWCTQCYHRSATYTRANAHKSLFIPISTTGWLNRAR